MIIIKLESNWRTFQIDRTAIKIQNNEMHQNGIATYVCTILSEKKMLSSGLKLCLVKKIKLIIIIIANTFRSSIIIYIYSFCEGISVILNLDVAFIGFIIGF